MLSLVRARTRVRQLTVRLSFVDVLVLVPGRDKSVPFPRGFVPVFDDETGFPQRIEDRGEIDLVIRQATQF